MVHFEKLPNKPDPVIGYLFRTDAAAKAGLQEGDKIVQIDESVIPPGKMSRCTEMMTGGHQLDVWAIGTANGKHFTFAPVMDNKTGVGVAGWAESSQIEIGQRHVRHGRRESRAAKGRLSGECERQPIRSTYKLHDIITPGGGKPVALVY